MQESIKIPRSVELDTATGSTTFSTIANYSLTIGQASSLLHAERCKYASNRKVQRICKDGVIDCHKLSTTRNGKPISEWLVNETSLRNHIEKNEIKWDKAIDVPAAAGGNANRSPSADGDAIDVVDHGVSVEHSRDAVAMPDRLGDAPGGTHQPNDQATPADVMAAPDKAGGATDEPIGETRSLASVLIENASLTAQLQGSQNLIEEVRDDKKFLREELIEARAGRKDVTAIAQRMLETLETIAIGGKLMQPHQDQKPDERSNETPTSGSAVIPHSEVVQSEPGDNPTSESNPFRV